MSTEVIFIAGKHPFQQLGGHSNYVRAHARAALRLGFIPHIFCVNAKSGIEPCEIGVLHCVASSVRPFRPVLIPAHAPKLTRAIRDFIRSRSGPALIHTFGAWYGIGLDVSEQMQRQGHKVINVASVYSTLRHEYSAKLAGAMDGLSLYHKVVQSVEFALMNYARASREERHLRRSDIVLVNYDSVTRIIESEYGSSIRCRKIPYCSEQAFLGDTGKRRSEDGMDHMDQHDIPRIVSVSRNDPRKGIQYLLFALAQLQASGIRFRATMVGGGSLTNTYRKLVSKLGLDECVSLEGWVPDSFRYLEKADVFVLPSIEEGSGSIALLEALQAGVPIIATGIDGIPEDVSEKEAVLVEPRNATALAQALKRLLTDPPLRSRMAAAARRRYENSFTADSLTRALGEAYAECGFPARP